MTGTDASSVVSRTLTEEATGAKVVVSVMCPERVADQEWRCAFSILGLGPAQAHYAHGLDAVQSLILSLDGIHSILSRSGRRLTWEGGEPGDTGFPPVVPQAYGLGVVREVEQAIDDAVAKYVERAPKRGDRGEA